MRIHLKDSPEPLNRGQNYLANCGEPIPHATIAFMWDYQEIGLAPSVNRLTSCAKCLKLPLQHRYIYGLVSGEEMKQKRG